MIGITPTSINLLDAILEGISLVAFIFILIMVIFSKKKNKIFASKGYPILFLSICLGTFSAGMDLFTEFFWIEPGYDIYKFIMSSLNIISLALFAFALLYVFRFTKFLMGFDEGSEL
ncbi:MAG: hypothetical protein ACTSWL_00450 [Promethearchaeota archaeon]